MRWSIASSPSQVRGQRRRSCRSGVRAGAARYRETSSRHSRLGHVPADRFNESRHHSHKHGVLQQIRGAHVAVPEGELTASEENSLNRWVRPAMCPETVRKVYFLLALSGVDPTVFAEVVAYSEPSRPDLPGRQFSAPIARYCLVQYWFRNPKTSSAQTSDPK